MRGLILGLLLCSQMVFGATQHGNQVIKGTLNVTGLTTLGTASSTQFNADNLRLDGNTLSTTDTNGNFTIDLNGTGSTIFADLTATTVPYLDANKKLTSSATTPTQLGYLGNATSNLCGINQACTLTNKIISSLNIGTTTPGALIGDVTGGVSIGVGLPFTGVAGIGTSAGSMYYSDGSKLVPIMGTNGQVPIANGSGAVAFGTVSATITAYPPSGETLTSGTTWNKHYTFVITSGSATAGATYTHNAVTYTVINTVSSATQIVLSGSSAPLASGTLTKSGGTGDSTLTFSISVAPAWLIVECVGGGGGGGGGGNVTPPSGTTGGTTTWGSTLLSCPGGNGGGSGASTGGALCTITAPAVTLANATGEAGGGFFANSTAAATPFGTGGTGGSTPFGSGGSGAANTAGADAQANSGGGGGGGGFTASATARYANAAGGAGAYAKILIKNPSATYAYSLSGTGAVGGAGTGGFAGGLGAAGACRVTAHYQ